MMRLTLFSLLYLALVSLLFFNIRESLRVRFLLLSSLVYIFALSRYSGEVILCVSVLTWLFGKWIGGLRKSGHGRRAAFVTFIAVSLSVLSLILFKYFPVLKPLMKLDESELSFLKLALPTGYSFFIFQVISYLVDVCRAEEEKAYGFVDVLLYLCWFPKYISGPIERGHDFLPQIEKVRKVIFLDMSRWGRIVSYFLTGCFYKVVIADRAGIYVNRLFEEHQEYGGFWLAIGAFLYSIQIYCDFAGYSYMAIGISAIFDINLTQNFRMPYLSANITEFWRRWHISLSSWLKDYLYIPLGGNRKGDIRKIMNTLLVFLVCGMWHGAGSGFLVWGLMHGLYSAVDILMRELRFNTLRKGFWGRVYTFLIVTFAWIFFRASSAEAAVEYIWDMFTVGVRVHGITAEAASLGLDGWEIKTLLILLFSLLVMEFSAYKLKRPVPELLNKSHYTVRCLAAFVLTSVLIVFGIYGPDFKSSDMIYMQF